MNVDLNTQLAVDFMVAGILILVAVLGMWMTRKKIKDNSYFQLKDVRINDSIGITYWDQNVYVKCLNNNPAGEEIYLRITFEGNKSKGVEPYHKDLVFAYNDKIFKHWRTLNVRGNVAPEPQKQDTPKTVLEEQLQSALKEERFEEAAVLRDAIKKINELTVK